MHTISVAIPCYEMGGWGSGFLQYSLDILKEQTFKDFDVVVSDHSKDAKVAKVCRLYSKYLDIKYIKNKNNRGSSSANINNCIVHSSGRIIKILCQDDYLIDQYALEKTANKFNYDKKWLITAYLHTKDRANLINRQTPRLNEKIYLENSIGTHSCLSILNDDPILFDENLIWYMDCEYYYRLYSRYGIPEILYEPTVIQLLWYGQVTNTLITQELEKKEREYVLNKYER